MQTHTLRGYFGIACRGNAIIGISKISLMTDDQMRGTVYSVHITPFFAFSFVKPLQK